MEQSPPNGRVVDVHEDVLESHILTVPSSDAVAIDLDVGRRTRS